MWLHPVFRTLASRPELLTEHAGAYVDLAAAEVDVAARQVRTRAALMAASLACAALGVGLAGTALLLLAVTPLQAMPAPWALAAAPAVPLGAALGFWWMQGRKAVDLRFAALREQLALDRQLWQQVTTS
jgi:uncharacterized membrane protein YqjE